MPINQQTERGEKVLVITSREVLATGKFNADCWAFSTSFTLYCTHNDVQWMKGKLNTKGVSN